MVALSTVQNGQYFRFSSHAQTDPSVADPDVVIQTVNDLGYEMVNNTLPYYRSHIPTTEKLKSFTDADITTSTFSLDSENGKYLNFVITGDLGQITDFDVTNLPEGMVATIYFVSVQSNIPTFTSMTPRSSAQPDHTTSVLYSVKRINLQLQIAGAGVFSW